MGQQSSAMGGRNSTKFILILAFVVVVLLIAVTAVVMLTQTKKSNPLTDGCDDQTGRGEATLIYKANKEFGPDCLRVSTGTKIIYKNDSTAELEVGVDPHPSHTGDRHVTNNEFDLPVAANGGTASVTLSKKGKFGIHNHKNPSARATIIVE